MQGASSDGTVGLLPCGIVSEPSFNLLNAWLLIAVLARRFPAIHPVFIPTLLSEAAICPHELLDGNWHSQGTQI